MIFDSCPDRDRILNATGHVVVTGGPGCGKTTVALRKALVRISSGIEAGQKVLFLSFSRAAVARIVQAARDGLPRASRQHLEVQTFHSFFWQLVRGHGYLLGAPQSILFLSPQDERVLRNGAKDDDPNWDKERERLFLENGKIAFDLFAPKALALLQGSKSLCRLIADRHPLIIVDEAQDTGTEQWACIETLAKFIQLVCLADLDQQIYDFRRDVSPERLKQIIKALNPVEIDLGAQNNRSSGVEIVKFGNDILANTPRGSSYTGVSQFSFRSDAANRDKAIRTAVGMLYKRVEETTGHPPENIGYFTNWGKGVTIIAHALQGRDGKREIPHRVIMDETEVLLATRVIAFCLEPVTDIFPALATGLELISELYRGRGDTKKIDQLTRNIADVRNGQIRGNAKCPKALKAILEQLRTNLLIGNPAHDWLTVKYLFENSGIKELQWVARLVIYLMAFNRGRIISDNLAEAWQQQGRYANARKLIERAITEDQIVGSDGDLTGINVMTMHKSKGKEFDAVIILHLGKGVSPLSSDKECEPHIKSRRLLRVGVTRAKHYALMLTDRYNPSPLLSGHKLND